MLICPRDDGEIHLVTKVSKRLGRGRLVAPAPELVGYGCEHGHYLDMGEKPIDSETGEPIQ